MWSWRSSLISAEWNKHHGVCIKENRSIQEISNKSNICFSFCFKFRFQHYMCSTCVFRCRCDFFARHEDTEAQHHVGWCEAARSLRGELEPAQWGRGHFGKPSVIEQMIVLIWLVIVTCLVCLLEAPHCVCQRLPGRGVCAAEERSGSSSCWRQLLDPPPFGGQIWTGKLLEKSLMSIQ